LKNRVQSDKLSLTILWERESIEEIKEILNSVAYYVSVDGKLTFDANTNTAAIVTSIFTEQNKK